MHGSGFLVKLYRITIVFTCKGSQEKAKHRTDTSRRQKVLLLRLPQAARADLSSGHAIRLDTLLCFSL